MNSKGFSLVEILVVIAIIALIGTFAAVAVNAARSKERDAVRLSHMRQMQTALEDFFMENNQYPSALEAVALGYGNAGCLSTDGFAANCEAAGDIIMRAIPSGLSAGLKGQSNCGGASNAYCYLPVSEAQAYVISFELENAVPLAKLTKGLNCAAPEGISAGACQVE